MFLFKADLSLLYNAEMLANTPGYIVMCMMAAWVCIYVE